MKTHFLVTVPSVAPERFADYKVSACGNYDLKGYSINGYRKARVQVTENAAEVTCARCKASGAYAKATA